MTKHDQEIQQEMQAINEKVTVMYETKIFEENIQDWVPSKTSSIWRYNFISNVFAIYLMT